MLLLFKGWTSVGPLYTSCTSFNSNVDMVYYIFSCRLKDTDTFQMPVSFIFVWRLEQQQVTHVSTAISRTVTEKQNSVTPPYSIRKPLTTKRELTHEGQDDEERSEVNGVGIGQIVELDPYLVQETQRFFLSIHPEAETGGGGSLTVRQLRGISLLRAVSSGSDTQAVRMSPFTHHSREIYMQIWDECERINGPVSWGNFTL